MITPGRARVICFIHVLSSQSENEWAQQLSEFLDYLHTL